VREHGLLVYATCSLEPEENEEQVDSFLQRHPEFVLEPPALMAPELLDVRGRLQLWPHVHGHDGAFAARMRRSGPIAG
jgi:16S rRNA (cytosine967-C5)-methyltransferase